MKKLLLAILLILFICLSGCTTKTGKKDQYPTECEKFGGSIKDLKECNGEISKICSMPDGETCYLENFRDGKCEGVFSPKVLCDTGQ